MQCVICRTLSEFKALENDWRGLEQRCSDALLPFQTYAWNSAWWASFAKSGTWRKDTLSILCFFVDSKLVAISPLFETRIGVGSFHIIGYLRPFGADPNLTEIRGPLALTEYLPSVLKKTVEFLMHKKSITSALHLIGPTAAVRAAEKCYGEAQSGIRREVTNYLLPLHGDWEQFRAGLKRNIKESLRRCYNSLKREGWTHDLQILTETGAILQNLPQFYALHAKRASLKSSTVNHPDYFSKPRHRKFIETVVEALNRDADGSCRAHLFCLRINEKIVAMRLAFRCNKEMYFYYSGFDTKYSQYSVTTTLLAESLRWCIEEGLQTANLSVGTDVSKTRWGPQDVGYLETHFVQASLRGRIAHRLLELKQRRARINSRLPVPATAWTASREMAGKESENRTLPSETPSEHACVAPSERKPNR